VKRPHLKPAARGRIEAVATEIKLGVDEPARGFLGRRSRRREDAGSLLITKGSLVLEARHVLRGRLEIDWDSIRKAVVDDGTRWGHMARTCRFGAYDVHPDGTGSGTLIGPLWSRAASVMPAACPMLEIAPVPAEPPNLALVFEPLIQIPSLREGDGGGAAILLLCAADPEEARALIAEHATVGEIDRDDLAHLEAVAGSGQASRGVDAGSAADSA
jgi:hypothetical protein